MARRRIFIENATMVDCAFLTRRCGPQGHSWFVDVTWDGELQADGVIMDFSQARRLAKESVDREYDHRLLVHQDQVLTRFSGRILVGSQLGDTSSDEEWFLLEVPECAVRVLSEGEYDACARGDWSIIGQNMAVLVQSLSHSQVPEISTVEVALRGHPLEGEPGFYRYTHSLRCHTGNCQRLHGHCGIVEVVRSGASAFDLAEILAGIINEKYWVSRDYIAADENGEPCRDGLSVEMQQIISDRKVNWDKHVLVRYAGSQGSAAIVLPRSRLKLMEVESTIENIVDYLHQHLRSVGVSSIDRVIAYEGLQKGAISQ